MKEATRTDNIVSRRDEKRQKNLKIIQSNYIVGSLKEKRFDDLTIEEKDELLKAIGLRLGFIRAD